MKNLSLIPLLAIIKDYQRLEKNKDEQLSVSHKRDLNRLITMKKIKMRKKSLPKRHSNAVTRKKQRKKTQFVRNSVNLTNKLWTNGSNFHKIR